MNNQKGFTLIELMIVVAIIGILASVAIPQYQDYIARTDATTSIAQSTVGIKKAIAEYNATYGNLPSGMTQLSEDVGYQKPDESEWAPTDFAVKDKVASVTYTRTNFDAADASNSTGTLAVVFAHANNNIGTTNFVYQIVINDAGTIDFQIDAASSGLKNKYLPKGTRYTAPAATP